MQMFRQNHDGIDLEGMILAGFSEGFAQMLDMLDQQNIVLAFFASVRRKSNKPPKFDS
jgi:hypothetical protein